MPEELTGTSLAEMGEFSDEPIEETVVGDEPVETDAPVTDEEVTEAITDEGDSLWQKLGKRLGLIHDKAEEPDEAKVEEAITQELEQAKSLKGVLQALKSYPDGPEKQIAMKVLGFADTTAPQVKALPQGYEPANELEEAIVPLMGHLSELPQTIGKIDRHAELIDQALVRNAYLEEMVSVLAETAGVNVPKIDISDILDEAYRGQDYKKLIKTAVAPAREKLEAVKAQNKKPKPRTPSNTSGVQTGTAKRMTDIHREYFGE